MDIKQLEYFVHVAELNSFTRASVVLNVAQPALSRQVRLLEVELRQNLLIRNGRGVTTTEAGKLLLEHGRGLLHQFANAKEELARLRGAAGSNIALGVPPSLSRILIVPLIRQFRTALPGTVLSVREGLSAAMQESLLNGRLDAAVLYELPGNAMASGVEITEVCEEELFLIEMRGNSNATAPVTLEDLAQTPLVIPSRPNAMRMKVETRLTDVGLVPTIALEIDSVSSLLDLVADGAGSAVLPLNALLNSTHADRLVARPVAPPGLRMHLVLAVSSHRPLTRSYQSMLDVILETTRAVLHGSGSVVQS